MPTPVERIREAFNAFDNLPGHAVGPEVMSLIVAITAALEAEREMRDCWRSFRDHPNDDYSRSVLNRHLGGG
jgi:hypothetical protein